MKFNTLLYLVYRARVVVSLFTISQFWWLDHFLASSLQLDTFILV